MQWRPKVLAETEFPRNGTTAEKLRFMLQYAVLAPSVNNTQPWKFSIANDVISLYADRSRALAVTDPQHRELTISCGAALEHIAIAIKHFGFSPLVEQFPDPDNPDLLAQIRIGSMSKNSADDALFFYGMARRQTWRRKFGSRSISNEMFANLVMSAANSEVWIDMLDGPVRREEVARLIGEADLIQGHDQRFREELLQWITISGAHRHDGMPGTARGHTLVGSIFDFLMFKKKDSGPHRAVTDRRLIGQSRLLAIIGTVDDEPAAWLEAGRSLVRLLLRARSAGISASFFGQVVQVAETREKLAKLAGDHGHPQLVLRLGYATSNRITTPRRALEKVILATPPPPRRP